MEADVREKKKKGTWLLIFVKKKRDWILGEGANCAKLSSNTVQMENARIPGDPIMGS